MKILFICNEYPPSVHGGIGTFVFTLAHQLVKSGQEVHVIGIDRSVNKNILRNESGVNVLRLRSPYWGKKYLQFGPYDLPLQIMERQFLSRQVERYCQQTKVELIESYDWSGPLWSHPEKPLLVRMHGAHSANALTERRRSSRFLSYIESRNLRMADCLVGVSHHISKVTLQSAGLRDRPYSVIYNGVDTTVFRPLGLEKNKNEVLFAGTVARRKGIYELFAAIPLVFEAVPEATFTILGRLPAEEEDCKLLLVELLQNLPNGKRDRVKFVGAHPYNEMPDWYNRATCAVFPSLAEAFGLTCAEAMACGTPVVMTSKASGPELVEDGVSGLLIDPCDKQALSNAIIQYLTNPLLRKEISTNSIRQIQHKFEINAITRSNIDQYERLLNNGS
jgi:glycosyltransferase involved in cell wall biosynthesis